MMLHLKSFVAVYTFLFILSPAAAVACVYGRPSLSRRMNGCYLHLTCNWTAYLRSLSWEKRRRCTVSFKRHKFLSFHYNHEKGNKSFPLSLSLFLSRSLLDKTGKMRRCRDTRVNRRDGESLVTTVRDMWQLEWPKDGSKLYLTHHVLTYQMSLHFACCLVIQSRFLRLSWRFPLQFKLLLLRDRL